MSDMTGAWAAYMNASTVPHTLVFMDGIRHGQSLCQLDMGRYDTFIASITVNKPSKRANNGGHHTVRPYVSIICPYCNNEFQEVVLERLKAKKASICKAHLAQCPAYRILTQKAHDEMADSREQV